MNIRTVVDEKKCSGCMACGDLCPRGAISFIIGAEGYYEPVIDALKCNDCGGCLKVCSSICSKYANNSIKKAYVFQNSNEAIRKRSTSGGAFSAIAQYFIDRNGVVIGAAYDDDWKVQHIVVDSYADISKLNGSKYVQSDLVGIYKKVKKLLTEDPKHYICFSGTPCEINGLINYLGYRYDNLFLVEVVCHGVGSPKLWQQYLNNIIQEKGKKIDYISFRSKLYGYAASCMLVEYDGKRHTWGKTIEAFKALYFKGYNIKPYCYMCNHKGEKRVADITLFDCWHMNRYDRKRNDNKGTTAVLVNTEVGRDLLRDISKKHRAVEVEKKRIIFSDGDMLLETPIKPDDYDAYLVESMADKSINDLVDEFCPYNLMKRVKIAGKRVLSNMGILFFLQNVRRK